PAIGGPVVAARPIWLPWGDGARFTARQVKPC
ncbi:MAG: hypothetical protein QOG64_1990, partial [Acidimicrobiaceae bacterium]|nr:hypothetical protein [Acidimicrobiaceae bacterium]